MNIKSKDSSIIEFMDLRREVYLCAKRNNPQPINEGKYSDLVRKIATQPVGNGLPSFQRTIEDEIKKTQDAIRFGYSVVRPDLSSAHSQLLWGLTSVYIRINPDIQKSWSGGDVPYPQSRIWTSLKDSTQARKERLQQSLLLSQTRTGASYLLRWGDPESWFYQHPTQKLVNIDLEVAMICGFDNTRSVALHEIGHAELSLFKPKKLEDLVAKIRRIEQKLSEKGSLTFDEYKRYSLAIFEQRARHGLWNAIEDNCVDRYAINHAERINQKISQSLNRFMDVIQGSPDQTDLDPERMERANPWAMKLQNLSNICVSAIFVNNGLFNNTYADWHARGIYPDWLSDNPDDKIDTHAQYSDSTQNQHLMRLLDMCDGPKGVGYLQPAFSDRRIAGLWDQKAREYCERRNAIITEIWDVYAEPLFAYLRREKEMQLEQMRENYKSGIPSCENGIPIEGLGDMPKPEGMNEGNKPPIEDPNPDKGQSIKDILEGKPYGDGDKVDKPDGSSRLMPARAAGSSGGLDKLPIGDWSDYQAMVKQYQMPINYVARLIRDLKRSQIESIIPPDVDRTLLPTIIPTI
jgi:hypothetical protein